MMRKSAAILILCLLLAAAAPAGDGMRAIAAVWDDFASALRRGDYPLAHSMFSAESRAAMPYRVFVLEYGPASAARELILSPAESLTARTDGDWGEISFSGLNSGSGRPFRVGVALVRNQGTWGLVAARNESVERLEASARYILSLAVKWRGDAEAAPRLSAWLETLEDFPARRHYRFETNGEFFRAAPLTAGLRAFHADEWNTIKPGLSSPPTPAQPPLPQFTPAPPAGGRGAPLPELDEPVAPTPLPPQRRQQLVDGLPEMSEPPGAPSPFPGLDVFREPDIPTPLPPRRPAEEWASPAIHLPDVIR